MIAVLIGIRCEVFAILSPRLVSVLSRLRRWVIVTLTVDPAASNRMFVRQRSYSDHPGRPDEAARAASPHATNHAKASPTRGSLVLAGATLQSRLATQPRLRCQERACP